MKNPKDTSNFLLKIYSAHVIGMALSLFLYSGCASSPVRSFPVLYGMQDGKTVEWPDSQSEKRFMQYWSGRFAGDTEAGYMLESPDFREVVPLEKYKNYVQHAVRNKLSNMEIRQIRYESDFLITIDCVARIKTGNGEMTEISMLDRWVMTSGKWYHIIKDPLIFSL